jgi:hypothetical protein
MQQRGAVERDEERSGNLWAAKAVAQGKRKSRMNSGNYEKIELDKQSASAVRSRVLGSAVSLGKISGGNAWT